MLTRRLVFTNMTPFNKKEMGDLEMDPSYYTLMEEYDELVGSVKTGAEEMESFNRMVQIQYETDSMIGSDGAALNDYIANNQNVDPVPLFQQDLADAHFIATHRNPIYEGPGDAA